jgi:hypothetical protein
MVDTVAVPITSRENSLWGELSFPEREEMLLSV